MLLTRIFTFVALAAPLLWLLYAISQELQSPGSVLGADPGEAIVHHLGEWSLRVLLLTLGISTLRRLLRQPWIMRLRRMCGLFAYTYVVLHFAAYLVYLAGWEWHVIVEDIYKRTYITVGFAALLLLTPLALTSTRGWQRRLRRRWQQLHKLIYPAAILALLHLFWLTKDGYAEVFAYSVVLVLLFGERMVVWGRATPARARS